MKNECLELGVWNYLKPVVISEKFQKFGASTKNTFRLTRLILGGLPKHLGISLDIYIKHDDFTGQCDETGDLAARWLKGGQPSPARWPRKTHKPATRPRWVSQLNPEILDPSLFNVYEILGEVPHV
jgi:hypothetical protein